MVLVDSNCSVQPRKVVLREAFAVLAELAFSTAKCDLCNDCQSVIVGQPMILILYRETLVSLNLLALGLAKNA